MNRKQLTIIIVLGVILGGLGLFLYQKDAGSWSASGPGLGVRPLADLPINDVGLMRIRQATGEVTLVRSDAAWTVKERHGYPANFTDIGDLLIKFQQLKAVQTDEVGPSQWGRLELIEPGKGANSGTLVEFEDGKGKKLGSVLLGKKHMRKGGSPSPMGGEDGWPDGRYLLVPGKGNQVALVSEAFSNVEPRADAWMNKDFFKVEKLKSVAVTQTNADQSWRVYREVENGDLKLADPKQGEDLDVSKASGAGSALSYPSFVDVAAPDAKPEETGMAQAVTAEIETFEGFKYSVKVGGKSGEDNHYMAFAVSADFPKERTPAADEKPEDKERLDKEFKEKTAKLEEKLKKESGYAKWTYVVSKYTIEQLLKERKDLLKQADPPKPPGLSTPGAGEDPLVPPVLPKE